VCKVGSAGARIAWLVAAATLVWSTQGRPSAFEQEGKDTVERRPKLALRAQPSIGISPARVVFTAELTGGANDFEDFYCPTIEWDWGDDTRSESTIDCEPYEAGKSQIRRRFTVEHVFRRAGAFKVFFRMKRRDKAIANQSVNIQIRPGGPPDF
jgi:hypothetical protein